MNDIVEYIKQVYEPISVIVYGSYADGSNNAHSDFDALVISKSHPVYHDVSFFDDVQLDVFVYPRSYFEEDFDREEFIQIFDGRIILDTDGSGASLQRKVLEYLEGYPKKSDVEVREEIEWCKKMLLRARRDDAEGFFRWHWLLTDSLEIFCDAVKIPYFGPKKALKQMKERFPDSYEYYAKALEQFDFTVLQTWIEHFEKLF